MTIPAGQARRVTLVRPPALLADRSLGYLGAFPPLGLAYVAGALRQAGHQVDVVDAAAEALGQVDVLETPVGRVFRKGLRPDEIAERIDPATEVVGLSLTFIHEWPTVREIATHLKVRHPGVTLVLGGETATACWRDILQTCPDVDWCVLGEGEGVFLELLERLGGGGPEEPVPGCVGRHQAAGSSVPARAPRIVDLDSLPRPAWDLFPMEKYLEQGDPFGVNRGRSLPMLATRGCPFQCSFCSSAAMWGPRHGARSPQSVVDEIRAWVETYRLENIDFCDLTPILGRDWILEFCERLAREQPGITWQLPIGTRSESLDEEVLRALYRSGCRNLTYAPESGSPRVLRAMEKRLSLPRLLESLKSAVRVGLVTRLNIIIGHPDEERRDLVSTLALILRAAWHGCWDLGIYLFLAYPGSRDYQELREGGILQGTDEEHYAVLGHTGHLNFNRVMTRGELNFYRYAFTALFYLVAALRRPGRFLDLLRSLWSGRDQSQVETFFRGRRKHLQLRRQAGKPRVPRP